VKEAVMSIHPKNILWPTDFSPLAMKGADYADAFRHAFRARLHVMHVCPILVWADQTVPVMSGGDMLVSHVDVVTPAKAELARLAAARFGGADVIEMHVVVGTPWYEICRYARDAQIDLIVIATHGATGLRRLVMGSTAERVVQHATAPVLAVKSIEREFLDDSMSQPPPPPPPPPPP
jgi:nucleotide-binding universal stress UspA family protein